MIYTFSPNWYKPQCIHLIDHSLYYCSNYLLYQYDLPTKAVTRQLCFRQIAIQHHLNHKDIKINAITSNAHSLLIGINQPYLILVDKEDLSFDKIIPLEQFQAVEYIYSYREGLFEAAILCNKDGYFGKIRLEQGKQVLEKIEIKHKLNGVKAIYPILDLHFAVFTRGTILIYNHDFSHLQKNIEVAHQDTIYSVDCLQENQHIYFAFLTKSKEGHSVTMFEFKLKEEYPLEVKKKVEEIGENVKRFNVSIYYPKKFAEKLKLNQKASMTIKLITPTNLVITGKFGQIITIHTQHIKEGSNLCMKPYSMQEGELEYSVWSDSRHYKEIYFIYSHQNKLFMVSTDHNLTIWQLAAGQSVQAKYLYSIKFLTAPVSYFFHAEHDPRTIFILLKDSAIRSFSPLEEGSHQLNEYWKFSKKYKIKKATCHPSEPGIVALATECNRLQLYDIYEDRLMKLIEIGEEIINISFEYPEIDKEIEQLFKIQLKEQKVQYVSHFVKEMENKTVLLVQTNKQVFLVGNLAQKEPWFKKGSREKRIERIHHNRYWDRQLLLASYNKNNSLTLFIRCNQKNMEQQLQLSYQQGRVLFKSQKNTRKLHIVNFKGNKFSLTRAKIKEEQGKIDVLSVTEIIVAQQIDYLHLNYVDQRIAVYCQRDDSIAVLSMAKLLQDKYEVNKSTQQMQLYSMSSKIDTLGFYLEDYLVIATKDQSIKVVAYRELQPLKINKKKEQNKTVAKVETKTQQKVQLGSIKVQKEIACIPKQQQLKPEPAQQIEHAKVQDHSL